MTFYQPATLQSDLPNRPNCSDCGTATELFGVEAEQPGCELLTFVCPKCKQIDTAVVHSASTIPARWPALQ
jgi:hypothetical protein